MLMQRVPKDLSHMTTSPKDSEINQPFDDPIRNLDNMRAELRANAVV